MEALLPLVMHAAAAACLVVEAVLVWLLVCVVVRTSLQQLHVQALSVARSCQQRARVLQLLMAYVLVAVRETAAAA